MIKTVYTVILFLLITSNLKAQWEVGLGGGAAIPITGYGEVVKTGWLIDGEGKYRFKSNFAVGMQVHYTRLQTDKDPNDPFQNARMTLAPVLFTAEYGWCANKPFQFYAVGGLGITFFSINYDTSPTTGESISNVSFTMMPEIGFRYAASKNIYPFLQGGMILIADGPPIGFPKGEKMTGYGFVSAGIQFRFH